MQTKILDSAAQLFAERGYEGVSMRDIAKVVGVTQANLYYHFRDKAALVEATLAHVFESRVQDLAKAQARKKGDPLGAFVHWFVDALTKDFVFGRLVYLELWNGDADRIDALTRTVIQPSFLSVSTMLAADREAAQAKRTALTLIGFILGQVLVRPLAPGLTGCTMSAASIEEAARRFLPLTLHPAAET